MCSCLKRVKELGGGPLNTGPGDAAYQLGRPSVPPPGPLTDPGRPSLVKQEPSGPRLVDVEAGIPPAKCCPQGEQRGAAGTEGGAALSWAEVHGPHNQRRSCREHYWDQRQTHRLPLSWATFSTEVISPDSEHRVRLRTMRRSFRGTHTEVLRHPRSAMKVQA